MQMDCFNNKKKIIYRILNKRKYMKKKIVMIQELESPDRRTIWRAGKAYTVVYENDDLYLLEKQDGIICGMDKANQDVTYRVEEAEDEN